MIEIKFPTAFHEQSIATIKYFFLQQENVDTILLVNSLARGKVTAN